jgi:hypothetical protein
MKNTTPFTWWEWAVIVVMVVPLVLFANLLDRWRHDGGTDADARAQ